MPDLSIFHNVCGKPVVLPPIENAIDRYRFHTQLPGFNATPLIPVPSWAEKLGVASVFVKFEGDRANLPAYKILGASWATFRAICEVANLPLSTTLDELRVAAQNHRFILFAATAGNHGRAVARLANILGISAHIFVDEKMRPATKQRIIGEGVQVTAVPGGYDAAVAQAREVSSSTSSGLLVQDFSDDPNDNMSLWHVEGYTTILEEIEQQLKSKSLHLSHLVTPVGGGTFGHAVVAHAKSSGRNVHVITVEPEMSACLSHSLQAHRSVKISSGPTIMAGMVSNTVNGISWPLLSKGVNTSVTISEDACEKTSDLLRMNNIFAGPCGAGTFAGFLKAAEESPGGLKLTPTSVVVCVCTDGDLDRKT